MNNQVKLIDETKLLKAVFEEKSRHERARDRLEIDHKYWEFHEGSVTTLEWLEKKIEKGMFAPDTTPVPTIKPGDKVRHDDWGDGVVYDLDEDDSAIAIVDFDDEGLMSIHCDELEVVE